MARGKHEGSFYKRISKTGKAYIEGRIQIDGSRYTITAPTLPAAREKINKIRASGGKKANAAKGIFMKDLFDRFLDTVKLSKKESTYSNYKIAIDTHLRLDFDKMPINKVTRATIQEFVVSKAKSDTKAKFKPKTISPRYVNRLVIILHATLKLAVLDGIITHNPVHDIVKPKLIQKQIRTIPSTDMTQCFNVDTSDDALATLAKFILFTGLRRGEALALQWNNVDFKNKTLLVEQSASRDKVISSPKTKSSIRTLPLSENVVQLLQQHKKSQLKFIQELKTVSIDFKSKGFVFSNDNGDMFSPGSIRKGVHRLLSKAGLPTTLSVHDLRHSYATMLLEIGVPLKITQEMLGHSSIKTTGDIYSHVSLGMKQQAVDKMNEIFKSGGKVAEKL